MTTVPGVRRRFATPVFHEAVLNVSVSAHDLLERLQEQRLLAGFDLSRDYPELGNALLVCVTETKTQADIEGYANALQSTLGQLQRAAAA